MQKRFINLAKFSSIHAGCKYLSKMAVILQSDWSRKVNKLRQISANRGHRLGILTRCLTQRNLCPRFFTVHATGVSAATPSDHATNATPPENSPVSSMHYVLLEGELRVAK